MISDKKLKERLLDICHGAGRDWLEADEYFESSDGELESTGRMIVGIEQAFNMPETTRLRMPWQLENMIHIDKLVELVRLALTYDMQKKE